jgi:hypothetical protein
MKSVAELTHFTVVLSIFPPDLPTEDPNVACYSVRAQYQPGASKWMVQGGAAKFLLLSSEVLDALLKEAWAKGYPVGLFTPQGLPVRVF